MPATTLAPTAGAPVAGAVRASARRSAAAAAPNVAPRASSSFAGVRLPGGALKANRVALSSRSRTPKISAVAATESQLSDINIWGDNRRLQTQVADIGGDVTTIRSLDWDRDRFDIEFGLQEGTTYNSYIIKGDKTALVDASHEKFEELYMAALKGQIDPSTIDYIVCSHTEPDHSGLVGKVLELAPNATVVGSKVCIAFLENLLNTKDFKNQVVKNGDTIDLGQGHELEFVIAPNLHWPDTMFSFDRKTGYMFTCDAFGLHYCSEDVYDVDLEAIESHYRFYYDCLMKPNSRSVLTALRKCKDLEWSVICNGHGPILKYNTPELTGKYKAWSEAVGKAEASVAVMYCSDYGFSDRLSQALARGVTKTGVLVEMVDLSSSDAQELVEAVGRSTGVVIMSPPQSGPAADGLKVLFSSIKGKQQVVCAESYGGDDEPVDQLQRQLAELGAKTPLDALKCKDEPQESDYQFYEEAGTDLGQSLTKKEAVERLKGAMSTDVAKALGRISGGLYVVTAARGDAKSAMIASWVSQASFEPLGLTISVAKDRAIESLMQVGDKFVLNCLEEGNYQDTMKHFLKRFPPGADRFEGVEWYPAACGSPVLEAAVSYMECQVVSRMETPDHWVVYSEVATGSVFKPDSRTAAHHRKVANYY